MTLLRHHQKIAQEPIQKIANKQILPKTEEPVRVAAMQAGVVKVDPNHKKETVTPTVPVKPALLILQLNLLLIQSLQNVIISEHYKNIFFKTDKVL